MKNNGYYNEKNLNSFKAALNRHIEAIDTGESVHVTISNANSKMGNVASVSLLPFITCPACCADTCGGKCYAAKLAALRPSVLNSYAKNTAIFLRDSETYWKEVAQAVAAVRFFRFHVSGDIVNTLYFAHMVQIATENPKTEILAFTKRFDVVNSWILANGDLPVNLHIMFSAWNNLVPNNPYCLPETNVYKEEEEIRDNWKLCGGNCFNCACRGVGCWQAQKGDVIAFKLH